MPDRARRRPSFWLLAFTMLLACAVCFGYRSKMPAQTTALAVIQVAGEFDVEGLCRSPKLLEDASLLLKTYSNDAEPSRDPDARVTFSGVVTSRKLDRASQPANSADLQTWELTYRIPKPDLAISELSAIVSAIQAQAAESDESPEVNPPAQELAGRMDLLQENRRAAEDQLIALPAEDEADLASRSQRTEQLELDHTDATLELDQMTDDWDAVELALQQSGQLDRITNGLPPGHVKDVLLQLQSQVQLSAELKRLNAAERQLQEIYGDRHPKLQEARKKFNVLLEELGGWENVLNPKHVEQQLQTLRASSMADKQDQVDDLALRLELETADLTEARELHQQRSELTATLARLDSELTEARQSGNGTPERPVTKFALLHQPRVVPQPWFLQFEVMMALAALGGVIAGLFVQRIWPAADNEDREPEPRPLPVFAAATVPALDLAQRRALRQARLKQAYA